MKHHIIVIFLLVIASTAMAGKWCAYPSVAIVSRVAIMHDKAFVVSGSTLCVADTGSIENYTALSKLNGLTGTNVFDIRYSKSADKLAIVYTNGNIDLLSNDNKILPIPDLANSVGARSHYPTQIAIQKDSLFIQTSTTTLVVDVKKGIILHAIDQQMDLSTLDEETAYSSALANDLNLHLNEDQNWVSNAAYMTLSNGRLITVQSVHSFYGAPSINGHISILDLESNQWSQIHQSYIIEKAYNYAIPHHPFSLVVAIGKDEANPDRFYVSAEGSGLYEFTADTLSNVLTVKNCAEGITQIISNYERISGVHGDAEGNLWLVCSGIDEKQLRYRNPKGQWTILPIAGFTNSSGGEIDLKFTKNNPYNFIWLIRNFKWNEFGAALYYRDPSNPSNNQSTWIESLVDQDGNAIRPYYLYDIIEDNDGAVWLLTSNGPFIIDDQLDFFNYADDKETANIGKVRRVKVPRNDGTNLADYLLNNVESVRGVVDAANNKWIGTKDNGLYCISADGLTELEHFTVDNSPLFSNAIQALEYDEKTGKLYIATVGGLCVYQTDAIVGSEDNNKIYCYPNPVRPEYSGKLFICNLKDRSDIRITDTTGHVIYQTTTFGGQTSWDLCNNSGNRVKPGIYYIYSIDEDGKDGGVTKVLIQ